MTPGAAGRIRWREAGLAVLPALVAGKLLTLLAMVVSIEHGAGSVTWGLLGQAFSLLLMRGGHMRGAALAAAFAVAMRLTGIVLLPVLAMELLRQHRARSDGLCWRSTRFPCCYWPHT